MRVFDDIVSNNIHISYFSCTQRTSYHLVFPDDAPAEDKLTLIGSSILIDIVYVEQDNGDGGGGN